MKSAPRWFPVCHVSRAAQIWSIVATVQIGRAKSRLDGSVVSTDPAAVEQLMPPDGRGGRAEEPHLCIQDHPISGSAYTAMC